MKCFGIREMFAIEYQSGDIENTYFELWVRNEALCCFCKDNIVQQYKWNISDIVEWLNINKSSIIEEIGFPLPIDASTSIDFYNRSGNFDSDDIDEFDRWYEERQNWYFRHSWYSNRAGAYLAEVFFRRVNNMIEVEWDNRYLYEGIQFITPKGLCYIDINLFQQVVNDFIEDFYNHIK